MTDENISSVDENAEGETPEIETPVAPEDKCADPLPCTLAECSEEASNENLESILEEHGQDINTVSPYDKFEEILTEKLDIYNSKLSELIAALNPLVVTKDMLNTVISNIDEKYKDIRIKFLQQTMVSVANMREEYIQLLNNMEANIETIKKEDMIKSLRSFESVNMTDILSEGGVNIFNLDEYAAGQHKIISVVPTENAELDKKICKKLSDGYSLDGKVIFQQKIILFKHQQKR